MNLDKPANEIDFATMMKFKFLMTGSFHLREDLEYIPIQTSDDVQVSAESSNDEEGYWNFPRNKILKWQIRVSINLNSNEWSSCSQ